MSHKNIKLTTVDAIFTRLKGSIPLTEESDIVEWIGDALDAIGAITQYEEAVCFATVKNYTAQVPKYCHAVIQLARNNSYDTQYPKASCVTPDHVTNNACLEDYIIKPITGSAPEWNKNQTGEIFSFIFDYANWYNSSLYKKAFTPIRLTEHSFFNEKVCYEKDHDKIYQSCTDEYNIIHGDTLKFSFPYGQVAISYAKYHIDSETGYPMIPENISYLTAIVNYCRWKWFEREFYSGREGAQSKMEKAESEWIWYCGQAKNKSLSIEGVDEHQNFLDQRSYLLPRRKRYFGFFGNLNKPEYRGFNNP